MEDQSLRGVITRFDGNIVVVEIEGEDINFPHDQFPAEAVAGDVIKIENGKVDLLREEREQPRD
ncbi:DUF3006 domain-containing protein [Peribacillus sp. SCS-155]|uniref:DUF3006 domain-containing protein n=1 Tax=Peribacillus sedimenti TaxID=3115297 RepID=UPI003906B8FE